MKRMRVVIEIKAAGDEWESARPLLSYARDTFNPMNLEQIVKEILPALGQIMPTMAGVVITAKVERVEE